MIVFYQGVIFYYIT